MWERFCLTSFSTNGTYASVGNIHFSPNSKADYDWLNKSYVESDWIDWRDNYPNLTGETVMTNYTAWCPSGKKSEACRNHHRWWFSLFPHVEGRTEDGYSNSWWDYLITLDFVVSIEPISKTIKLDEDEELSKVYVKAIYHSGKTEKIKLSEIADTITIENEKIVTFKNGKLVGKKAGETTIEVAMDGYFKTINVEVLEVEEDEEDYDYDNDEIYEDYEEDIESSYTWLYASEWALAELETAKAQGLIAEILDERNYTEAITREEFAITMVRLYEEINGLNVEVPSDNPFTDTDNDEVLKAYALGVTNGTSENTFSPDQKITRQEIATMLMRLIEASGVYISPSDLTVYITFNDDMNIADWAKQSIYFMSNKGIIKGKGNNLFAPLDNTSIEEALVLAVRTLYDCKY